MIQRVAAYCRVSTDSADQTNSLANQEKFFQDYINRNPEWQLVQIFVDTGITGTSTKKRIAFNRMISEAISGNFSLILTKEISRFARNTLDSIYYTRKLKDHGIGVIFMNDNINTLDADSELRLTIMSSIAQEESRKTSERVKWGQKRRMEQGVVFGRDLLGYDVRNGALYVNKEGAEIVRLIFHKYVNEGKGTHTIAKELQEAGIPTPAHMKHWSNTVILRIIQNSKYCGDLIQKKTITPNYLNHEKKYNKGEEEFIILRDHHEPIINRELFERAQLELNLRSHSHVQKSKYSNRYCFSGKIKCSICGSSYVSRTKKRTDGSIYKSWRCYQAARNGARQVGPEGIEIGCNCSSINEDHLKSIMQRIVETLEIDKTSLVKTVCNTISTVLRQETQTDNKNNQEVKLTTKLETITSKKQGLLELYLSKEISKDEFQQMNEKFERDIESLKQTHLTLKQQTVPPENFSTRLDEIHCFISSLINGKDWNDTFYRTLLDTITVYPDNTITICLILFPYKWIAIRD